jgi:hypothetical protein
MYIVFAVLLGIVFGTEPRVFPGGEFLRYDRHIYTWIFGKTKYVDQFVENLDIDPNLSQGFIQLAGDGKSLEITLVQRPRDWKQGTPFCSRMLPAAVRDLYAMAGMDVTKLERIEVENVAKPKEAGCKCYVRLMLAMGLNVIGNKSLSEKDIDAFCGSSGTTKYIRGELEKGQTAHSPSVSSKRMEELNKKATLDRQIYLAAN